MEITKFNEKFNKLDGKTYTVEEEIFIVNGKYEGELIHDNVEQKTINVYTGSKLTGNKINSYTLLTPSNAPWKTIIKIYSDLNKVFVSYQTIGDQVEAEDINKLQDSVISTQEELNKEVDRAVKRENNIEKDLTTEINRAKDAESIENTRAINRENVIENNLNKEIKRATDSENNITKNLDAESNRAKKKEEELNTNINTTNINLKNETNRATQVENTISNNLSEEITRAKNSEKVLKDDLDAEVNRATNAESKLTTDLNIETNRAKGVESEVTNNLNKEIDRAKAKENSLESNINNYKTLNDGEIQKLKEKDIDLQNKKSDLSYVNSELNKRYTKDQTFTREEVLQKIKDVIGTAPEALDTLQEIAKALNNDADFAGTMTKQLTTKVDKVQGKQLSDESFTLNEKNKLAKVENEANKYLHPANHSADIIVDNPNKRFTNDTEKANNLDSYNKRHEHGNKSIIDKITQSLLDTWNNAYSHINDTVKHITSNERTLWNTISNKLDKTANAVSATKLFSARKINSVDFDGTKDITITDNTKLSASGGKLAGDLSFEIIKNGQSKGVSWEGLTDGHYIYVEEYGNAESTRLVISNKDNGDTDYTVFRNNSNGGGNGTIKDVFEIHNTYVKSNSKFTVEAIDGQINAKKGNNLAVLTTSSINGEYLVGGKNADDNSDFIKHYIRIGSNKLQYTSNGNTKNIILEGDSRLTNSRLANGGNSDTVDNLHSTDFARAYNGSYGFGGSQTAITTSQFIDILKKNGAFNQPFWVARGSWSYANNQYITDTCCGNIHLAGCTVEVIGTNSAFTIRIHTPTTAQSGGVTEGDFIYINNGAEYSPKWRRIYNTSFKPKLSELVNDKGYITASDVDTSQNHVHNNKGIIDKITQSFLDNWNTVSNKLDKTANAVSATKATQDGNGSNIANTYVKKGCTWGQLKGV